MHELGSGKKIKMWDTSTIFKIISKVNNHPLGEKSPNVVTLVEVQNVKRQNVEILMVDFKV
jgi:hypothetical protein